jgi:hypothetical protein
MKYKEAIDILSLSHCDLSRHTKESKKLLFKKQFYKLALFHHPDKNDNSIESTLKFQKLNEAYQFLCSNDNTIDDKHVSDMMEVFFNKVVHVLVENVEVITTKFLEGIDKSHAHVIYKIIEENELLSTIHLQKLWSIIEKKYTDDIYYVYPSLKDILENNVYLLSIENQIYTIPLWFREVVFDNNVIVKCIPQLPSHIDFDMSNNIIVKYSIKEEDYLQKDNHISVPIYDGYTIYLSEKKKMYQLRNKGISIANEEDIYDIHEKTDIIIYLTII